MARAIVSGMLKKGFCKPGEVLAADAAPQPPARQGFSPGQRRLLAFDPSFFFIGGRRKNRKKKEKQKKQKQVFRFHKYTPTTAHRPI